MDSRKAGLTRRRMDEHAWRSLLQRFEGAAMTVQEFCQREGLTRSVFMRWRARLRSSSRPLPAAAAAKAAAAVAKPSFLDLGLLGGSTSTATGAVALAATAAQHSALDLR
jgi:hypothetical protein